MVGDDQQDSSEAGTNTVYGYGARISDEQLEAMRKAREVEAAQRAEQQRVAVARAEAERVAALQRQAELEQAAAEARAASMSEIQNPTTPWVTYPPSTVSSYTIGSTPIYTVNDKAATWSLVFSLFGIGCCPVVGPLLGIILAKNSASKGKYGRAKTGLVIGIILLIVNVIWIVSRLGGNN